MIISKLSYLPPKTNNIFHDLESYISHTCYIILKECSVSKKVEVRKEGSVDKMEQRNRKKAIAWKRELK